MRDSEFIDFCAAHSARKGGAFTAGQLARLSPLAGQEDEAKLWEQLPSLTIVIIEPEQVMELVTWARERYG